MDEPEPKLSARRSNPVAFSYGGVDVLCDEDDLVNLNQTWEAAGKPANKDPRRWADTEAGSGFVLNLARNLNVAKNDIWKSRRGKHLGGTWAHWQIATAYAKYLSHDFHLFVNEAFRRWMNGENRFPGIEATPSVEMTTSSPLVHQARMFLAMAERQDELASRINSVETRYSRLATRVFELEGAHDQAARLNERTNADVASMFQAITGASGFYTLVAWAKRRKIYLGPSRGRTEVEACKRLCLKFNVEPCVYRRPSDDRPTLLFPVHVLEAWFEGYSRREDEKRPTLFRA